MKKILIVFVLILAGAGVYWYVSLRTDTGPTNPPTAEELRRIREVEESSSRIDPNAVPGAGVRPPGSMPRPAPEATTTPETASSTSGTSSAAELQTENE